LIATGLWKAMPKAAGAEADDKRYTFCR
jgi:hypothetical protein